MLHTMEPKGRNPLGFFFLYLKGGGHLNPLKKKSQGLGDTVEKVAYIATLGGIVGPNKKKDCGCKKRQQALNDKMSYKRDK
jgi:hypothetical protein